MDRPTTAHGAARRPALPPDGPALALADLDDGAVMLADTRRLVVWTGPRFEALTGFTPAQAAGRDPAELVLGPGADADAVSALRAALDARPDHACELCVGHRDGRPCWLSLRLRPVSERGEHVGFAATIRDVTAARLARADAQALREAVVAADAAAREKSMFIASMSHELRTPLQAVLGFSELGAAFAEGDGQLAPMFAEILDGGRRMLTLVNGLLDIGRPEGLKLAVQPRPVALGALIAEVVRELRPLAGERGVTIDTTPESGCPVVHADPFRLHQVLRNVLGNALRLTAEHSVVTVAVADLGRQGVSIAVRDHGPGIDADELERIFEPFAQSRRTRDGAGGSGLGLSMCRRILDAHGGSIAASLPADGGALFTIHLPAAPAVQAAPAGPATAACGAPAAAAPMAARHESPETAHAGASR